jgi:hypothetical protein
MRLHVTARRCLLRPVFDSGKMGAVEVQAYGNATCFALSGEGCLEVANELRHLPGLPALVTMSKLKPYLVTAAVVLVVIVLINAVIKPMLPASIQAYL